MDLLRTRKGRAFLFTWLYLSEGAPIGFIWWALPTLLRKQGVEVDQIGRVLALLVLPWAFKFLWAPLVDALRTPRWNFKQWIVSAQLMMGLTLLPFLWLDPLANFNLVVLLLFCHAFAAATQDVAVDALAIRIVPPTEFGTVNGFMNAGMLVGRGLFGGGTLIVAATLGLQWVFAVLLACVWSSAILLLFLRVPQQSDSEEFIQNQKEDAARHKFRHFLETLAAALRLRRTWFGLAFALVAASGFEAVGALAGPFLIDQGAEQEAVGRFYGIWALAAMVAGGLIGGRVSDRFGRRKAVALFLAGFVAAIAALAAVTTIGGVSEAMLFTLLGGMYFCVGLFTAASYALFMAVTDKRLGATQFSAFMGATNGCEAWSVWAGGQLAARAGYPSAFLALCAVSLLSLPLLMGIKAGGGSNGNRDTPRP